MPRNDRLPGNTGPEGSTSRSLSCTSSCFIFLAFHPSFDPTLLAQCSQEGDNLSAFVRAQRLLERGHLAFAFRDDVIELSIRLPLHLGRAQIAHLEPLTGRRIPAAVRSVTADAFGLEESRAISRSNAGGFRSAPQHDHN